MILHRGADGMEGLGHYQLEAYKPPVHALL